jgi:metal-responsive CopG/Arc/MetJ family transcriptional regulator
MKTAISVPDDTFGEVEQRARALGMSRSQFYTAAARHYLDELNEQATTDQINEALVAHEGADDSATAAVRAGRRRLSESDEEW